MKPDALLKRAETSTFYRRLLNLALWRIIPFNKPHGILVHRVTEDTLVTRLPFKRLNLNHIKGLHACGMATLAEFTTGLSLLKRLDTSKYRIIMKKISMEYFFQGKSDAYAEFVVSESWLKSAVLDPLNESEKVDVTVEVKVLDSAQNHLSTGTITWQIKDWEKVKTKK